MAQPTTIEGRLLVLYKSDGGSPAVWSKVCGIEGKDFNRSKATFDAVVTDCADPTLVPWVKRGVSSKTADVSGTGFVDVDDGKDVLEDAFASDVAEDWRIAMLGVGYWQGAYHVSALSIGGPQEGMASVSLTLQSHGAITWTDDTSFGLPVAP